VLVAALVVAAPGSPAAQPSAPGLMVVSLPAASWGVTLALPDFVITESRTRSDGTARALRAERRAAGMILSAFIVPAPAGDGARDCRDAFWQRLQSGPAASSYRDVHHSETGDTALTEYVISEVQGMRIDQKHLHAYLGKAGSCIEIHLSKTLFEPSDQQLFTALLAAVRLIETRAAPPEPTTRIYRVSGGDAVALMVPPSWQDEFPGGSENAGPTLSLLPATTGKDVLFMMTVIVPPPARRDGSYNTPEQLRRRTEAAGSRLREKIVESTLPIEEVRGAEIVGYMFTVTDKKPEPGPWNFLLMTHVEAALRDVMVSFSLFFQAHGGPEQTAAFEVFKGARFVSLEATPR
jgi:hypothetical protein